MCVSVCVSCLFSYLCVCEYVCVCVMCVFLPVCVCVFISVQCPCGPMCVCVVTLQAPERGYRLSPGRRPAGEHSADVQGDGHPGDRAAGEQ